MILWFIIFFYIPKKLSLFIQKHEALCPSLYSWMFFHEFMGFKFNLKFQLNGFLLSLCVCSKLFTEFILNVPVSRLTIQKLYCLIEIVHSDLFTQHGEQAQFQGLEFHRICGIPCASPLPCPSCQPCGAWSTLRMLHWKDKI